MDPNAMAGLIGAGLAVATIALVWGIIVWARGTRSDEVATRDEIIADLRRTLEGERRRERIRAAGAAADLQRASALAAAAAAGDLSGVLQSFPDDGTGGAPSEPSYGPDEADIGSPDA